MGQNPVEKWTTWGREGVGPGSPSLPRVHVVLVEPEIPPNTGNIARLCGATRSILHLVHPLGFRTDDRSLKRAGLDYWDSVEVRHHQDLEAFLSRYGAEKLLLFTKKASRLYTQAPYADGCFLLFGKETKGLPGELLKSRPDHCYRIPIWGEVRSLNLSTAAGIVVYEAYRSMAAGDLVASPL